MDAMPIMPLNKTLWAHFQEARYNTLRALRMPGYAVPFLVLPIAIYLLLGVVITTSQPMVQLGRNTADYLFCGFAVFAVSGPGLFGGALFVAFERESGLLRLKRALPMPTGAPLIAKAATAMLFSAVALLIMTVAALIVGRITLTVLDVAIIWVVMVFGTIPFLAIGLFIGAWAPGPAAPACAHLVFMPMFWLSGLFIPLPAVLQPWVILWPTFHLTQLGFAAAGVHEFQFVPAIVSFAVLAGFTALFGGLALRRLGR
jgi:ABC-2 type transport system permease protein